jgi:hypothetical protein
LQKNRESQEINWQKIIEDFTKSSRLAENRKDFKKIK